MNVRGWRRKRSIHLHRDYHRSRSRRAPGLDCLFQCRTASRVSIKFIAISHDGSAKRIHLLHRNITIEKLQIQRRTASKDPLTIATTLAIGVNFSLKPLFL